MQMLQAIPALPVKDVTLSLDFYRDKLGFTVVHQEGGLAVLVCHDVQIHLWVANDDSWKTRSNPSPVCTGAESFIAGTVSCQIRVEGVDELHDRMKPMGIVHPNAQLCDQPWGVRDFGVLDRQQLDYIL
ncbi:bleomycin resistance protein [Brevibacillus choshinensis]|uniref:Bleomycin resistance protein n=1 Tax=Brevibacillus choshinensis TaxID=54911 RepID=A0ABR5N3K6_BRECH|nr:bleomycin resistance protein [Brevibacillus choshinensis]